MNASLPEVQTKKTEPEAKPLTCKKCGAKVCIDAKLHSYVCHLYSEQRKGAA
jgi:hypothetical protein